jgi:WD40 repeat protein/tetratricopeptide (TPR) repeat protein
VHFADGGVIAVLSDGLDISTVDDVLGRAPWRRVLNVSEIFCAQPFSLPAPAHWDDFCYLPDGPIALLTADGQVGLLGGVDGTSSWCFTLDGLADACFTPDTGALLTVDEQNAVARWEHPQTITQRRPLLNGAPRTWSVSADGSTALFGLSDGRVIVYQPETTRAPRVLLRPGLLGRLPGTEEPRMTLATNADGSRAVTCDGSRWRFFDLTQRTSRTFPWTHPRLTEPVRAALSSDGELAALLVRSASGDRQRIALRSWNAPPDRPRRRGRGDGARLAPFDFVGAAVRDIAFVPHDRDLLVARSNGQLFLLEPGPPGPAADEPDDGAQRDATPQRIVTQDPWLSLNAAITHVAFSRTGEYLAVACEDRAVRLISTTRGEVRNRIRTGAPASSLAFNPRDDVLLIRTTDGSTLLCDPATGETVTEWSLAVSASEPLGVWVGNADAMLLSEEGAVFEHRFEHADMLIERTRASALQRRIAERVAEEDFNGAWDLTRRLADQSAPLAAAARVSVVGAALRRPRVSIPDEWTDGLTETASAATLAELGHAAYDGERFELAHTWLRRARELSGGRLDARTLRRIAECDYLLGAYDDAAAGFTAVLESPDCDPRIAPTVGLQRVAALVMASRPVAARRAALLVNQPDPWGRHGDPVAGFSARMIARVMTGLEEETLTSLVLSNLPAVFDPERRLLYLDDGQFFSGELARQRGDLDQAAASYQRCVDLSRDAWPANWARFRLEHLAAEASQVAAPAPDGPS